MAGGLFGSIANFFHRRGARRDKISTQTADVHARAVKAAMAQHIEGEPVNVGAVIDDVIARERQTLGDLYDYARANPVTWLARRPKATVMTFAYF